MPRDETLEETEARLQSVPFKLGLFQVHDDPQTNLSQPVIAQRLEHHDQELLKGRRDAMVATLEPRISH